MGPSATPVSVDVVLPCLDEAGALPWVLSRMPPGYRAVVVDNGSTDGSGDIARAAGALVVDEPVRGFGAAAHAGLLAATADVVCFCDADGSLDPAQLPELVAPVLAGRAQLVLGARQAQPRSAWPLHARVANRGLSLLMRWRAQVRLTDLGPMRAARRTDLLGLDLQDRRSGYPLEVVLRAARAGWVVQELPVAYSPRIGRSKVTGTVRGTITAVGDMSRLLRSAS